jgi:PAS domain S-box-containing protein
MPEGGALHRLIKDVHGVAVDYEIVLVNRAFENHTGMAASEVEGHLASQIYPGGKAPYLQQYAQVAITGQPESIEVYFAPLNRYFSISIFSQDKDWFVTVFSDITKRKRQEEEGERLRRLYALIRNINQAVVRTGLRDELFQQVCRIATQVGGFMMASAGVVDIENQRIKWVGISGDTSGFLKKTDILINKGPKSRGPSGTALCECRTYVCNNYATDSRTRPWREAATEAGIGGCIALPIMNNGKASAVVTIYTREIDFFQSKEVSLMEEVADDVSFALDHMEQEAALHETTQRFHTLLDEVRLVALGLDAKGAVTYANPFFYELTGYAPENVLGMPWIPNFVAKRSQPENYKIFSELLGDEQHIHHTNSILTQDGKERLITWNNTVLRDRSGKPEGTMSIGEDITERKQMEENLFRAQRMESIGLLAGGVAHDLNNILSPIMMSASMLRGGGLSPEITKELIENIKDASFRGAAIVKQVLTFARGVKGEHAVLKPQALGSEVWGLMKETFPKSITSTVTAPNGLWNIIGDHTQMCQVLLNLCVNARDAMPNGGKLRVDFSNIEIGDRDLSLSPEAKVGRYVKFEVTDTGTGILPENMHRIFDPFFTTKELGIGTGLGLSTAMGIVKNHGGFVTAESQLGQGTTFRVFIPANANTTDAQPLSSRAATATGNGETILVVDDEAHILQIAEMVFTHNGYKVLTANNGVEALDCLTKHSGEIDLIITDLMMPVMDGVRLMEMIRKFGIQIPAIVASGYGKDDYQEQLISLGIHTILKKPFDAEALLASTYQILHSK